MIRVEALGKGARGSWQAHRTFMGMWAIQWTHANGDLEIELVPNLPDGAYIRGCDSGERCT